MAQEPQYWFAAKSSGWGWDLNSSIPGKLLVGIFLVLVITGSFFFQAKSTIGYYIAYVTFLCIVFILICWLKGEPLRERRRHTE